VKDEKYTQSDAAKASGIVPLDFFAEIENRKDGKDRKRYDFLDGFELPVVNSYEPMRFAGT
jgi:hypothetical protein